ncbi:MAG: NUDIX hydrolase [Dehalococcoidia bacterium]
MSIQNPDHVWSAGGLVFKELASQNDVLVCGFAEPNSWRLPKGRPDGNESPSETALREVNEETGIVTEIVGFIDSIRYSYVDQFTEKRFYKTVYFYLMRPIGGDIAFHDDEFDIVKWMSSKHALEFLKFEHERGILEKGLSMES